MSQAVRILLALALGLGLGALTVALQPEFARAAVSVAQPVGGMWLDALRMTIVPLIVALIVTGIASTAEAARAGRLTARAIVIFIVLLWISSISVAISMPLFFELWPAPEGAADALRAVAGGSEAIPATPGIGEFLRSIVPSNPIAAAANDALLPLVVFSGVLGFAVTRLPAEPRKLLSGFFSAIADAMLVIIGWVLWIAPIGVFALAFAVGATVGVSAAGVLAHYVVLISGAGIVVTLMSYGVAAAAGLGVVRYAKAMIPVQAVAASTQSSLASLPPMLVASSRLGIPPAVYDVVLPMAVAVFRMTGPAMNLGVAIYIALAFGIELGPWQIAAGVAAGAITTMGAVGLPGQVSFITSIAPICAAMGVPVEPLALLIAVENIPDIVRTLGNVSMDVAATGFVGRGEENTPEA